MCNLSLNAIDIETDHKTQLVWQNNSLVSEVKEDWEGAHTFCENLVLEKYDDWRLPTIKELQTIVDTHKSKPAIAEGFAFTKPSYYWSSTPRLNDPYNSWLVHFLYGNTDYSSTSGKNHIRCVR